MKAYKVVLSNIIFQTDWLLQAISTTSDLEQGLMTFLKQEFAEEIPYIGLCAYFIENKPLERNLSVIDNQIIISQQ